MASLNISLPDELKEFVEAQVAKGQFGTASEYIRQLIRQAAHGEAEARLDAMLLEGLRSGPPIEVNEAYWERKRQELEAIAVRQARAKSA